MPLIPALRKQRQADLWEFEASLMYKASVRTARTVSQKTPVSGGEGRREKKQLEMLVHESSEIQHRGLFH